MSRNFEAVNLSLRVGNYLKRKLPKKDRFEREQFIAAFEINERTLNRWKSGELNRIGVIEEIAYYFGVSVWDVLSDEDGDVPFFIKNWQVRLPAFFVAVAKVKSAPRYGVTLSERKKPKKAKTDVSCQVIQTVTW